MTRYNPLWLQADSYAASVDRRMLGALMPLPRTTGCAVSVSSGMTVNVAAGQVMVTTTNATGNVLCVSDAVEPVTLAAAPGSGSNRIDVVICQARGNDLDGGANNDFLFTTVTGTAASTPTVPATPANATAIAQILVPGGSASVVAGNITDVRITNLGSGIPIFPTTALRDTGWVPGAGQLCVVLADNKIYQRVSGAWQRADSGYVVGYATNPTDTLLGTSYALMPSMQITFTGIVGRQYHLVADSLYGVSSVIGAGAVIQDLRLDGVSVNAPRVVTWPQTPSNVSIMQQAVVTPGAGIHTAAIYASGTISGYYWQDGNILVRDGGYP